MSTFVSPSRPGGANAIARRLEVLSIEVFRLLGKRLGKCKSSDDRAVERAAQFVLGRHIAESLQDRVVCDENEELIRAVVDGFNDYMKGKR